MQELNVDEQASGRRLAHWARRAGIAVALAVGVTAATVASATAARAGEPHFKLGYKTRYDCLIVNGEYQRYYNTGPCYFRDVPSWAGRGWAFVYYT